MQARPALIKALSAEVEWRLFGTGPAIVEAFRCGEIDLAYIGLPPAVIGIARGVKIKCIAGGHVEGTVIASRKEAEGYPELGSAGEVLSQFRRVGVPGRGSIHDLILMDALEGVDGTVEVRNFSWADEVLDAFVRGDVEAVVGTPALAQAVITFGRGRIVFPPHLLWPDNPSYGIVAREDLVQEHRPLLMEFLICHMRASEMLRNEKESVARDIAGLLGLVDRAFVLGTLGISPRYCIALPEAYIRCTMRLAARLRALGYIDRDVSEDEVFDLSIVGDVHPEVPHYR